MKGELATAFGLAAPAAPERLQIHRARVVTYAVPVLEPDPDGALPLLDPAGQPLGPKLSEGQFCDLAAQGSAVIGGATYRVVGTGRTPQISCRRYYSRLARKMPVAAGALGRVRFERIDWPHGLGARDYRLVPLRSAAASSLPIGTVLYVPHLQGASIDATRAHDGYVFVADRLADVDRPTIAILVEPGAPVPAALLQNAGRQAGVRIVSNPAVRATLDSLHRLAR